MKFSYYERVACGREINSFGVTADAWRLYRLSPGGKPTLVGQLGTFTFQAGKGWSWEDRPKTGYAFLRLDIYGNCHVPDGSLLWALDRKSGELHRPKLITPTQRVDAYTYGPLDELGGFRLERDYYALEGPVADPLPFHWDQTDGNWYAEGISPQGGPNGAPESPARVYSTKP
jgi:hypothetical protein